MAARTTFKEVTEPQWQVQASIMQKEDKNAGVEIRKILLVEVPVLLLIGCSSLDKYM